MREEKKSKYYYLLSLQFLGFRYHGWQKQKDVGTVQERLERTLRFLFPESRIKTLGSSRTDAMVSAQEHLSEIFSSSPLPENLCELLNQNLPQDIKALRVEEVTRDFQIIGLKPLKTYQYLFCYGERPHPFSAPLISHITERLDIDSMKKGASLFEGTHYFHNYIHQSQRGKLIKRTITQSQLIENNLYQASFFPHKSYIFQVSSQGFGRYQVRKMMGALFNLGMGKLSLSELENSLQKTNRHPMRFTAPASGLILYK